MNETNFKNAVNVCLISLLMCCIFLSIVVYIHNKSIIELNQRLERLERNK